MAVNFETVRLAGARGHPTASEGECANHSAAEAGGGGRILPCRVCRRLYLQRLDIASCSCAVLGIARCTEPRKRAALQRAAVLSRTQFPQGLPGCKALEVEAAPSYPLAGRRPSPAARSPPSRPQPCARSTLVLGFPSQGGSACTRVLRMAPRCWERCSAGRRTPFEGERACRLLRPSLRLPSTPLAELPSPAAAAIAGPTTTMAPTWTRRAWGWRR